MDIMRDHHDAPLWDITVSPKPSNWSLEITGFQVSNVQTKDYVNYVNRENVTGLFGIMRGTGEQWQRRACAMVGRETIERGIMGVRVQGVPAQV